MDEVAKRMLRDLTVEVASLGVDLAHGLPPQRERIATAALQGLLANDNAYNPSPSDTAIAAVEHADALIAALEGTEK